jgi:hypothetical protein
VPGRKRKTRLAGAAVEPHLTEAPVERLVDFGVVFKFLVIGSRASGRTLLTAICLLGAMSTCTSTLGRERRTLCSCYVSWRA